MARPTKTKLSALDPVPLILDSVRTVRHWLRRSERELSSQRDQSTRDPHAHTVLPSSASPSSANAPEVTNAVESEAPQEQ
jgi:hypothetical protein